MSSARRSGALALALGAAGIGSVQAAEPGPPPGAQRYELKETEDRLEVRFTAVVPTGTPPPGYRHNQVALRFVEDPADWAGRAPEMFQLRVHRQDRTTVNLQVSDPSHWRLMGYFPHADDRPVEVSVDLGRRSMRATLAGASEVVDTGFLRVPRRGWVQLDRCPSCTGELVDVVVRPGGGEPWPVLPKFADRPASTRSPRKRGLPAKLTPEEWTNIRRKANPVGEDRGAHEEPRVADEMRRSWLGR